MLSFVKNVALSIITLILLAEPVAASDVKVDYDFYNTKLSIYWNLVNNESDYLLKIYTVIYNNCIKGIEEIKTEQILAYEDNEKINLEDTPIGKYEIHILNNAGTTTYYKKEVYIHISSESMSMSWCKVDFAKPNWYYIYSKETPDEIYSKVNYINTGDIGSHLFNDLPAFSKIFMVVTATNDIIESAASNEAILFIALPSNLKNMRLELQ